MRYFWILNTLTMLAIFLTRWLWSQRVTSRRWSLEKQAGVPAQEQSNALLWTEATVKINIGPVHSFVSPNWGLCRLSSTVNILTMDKYPQHSKLSFEYSWDRQRKTDYSENAHKWVSTYSAIYNCVAFNLSWSNSLRNELCQLTENSLVFF